MRQPKDVNAKPKKIVRKPAARLHAWSSKTASSVEITGKFTNAKDLGIFVAALAMTGLNIHITPAVSTYVVDKDMTEERFNMLFGELHNIRK
jgi:hypothetical protein